MKLVIAVIKPFKLEDVRDALTAMGVEVSELGRSDFLRQLGQSYAEWEARGVRLVVNEIRVRFRSPARYDELVQVHTWLKETGRRRVVFAYRIERAGTLLAEGESIHLVAGTDNRARVLPDDLLALVQRP